MHFAIRFLHGVRLRRARDRQPQRAARAPRDDLEPALRRVHRADRPRGARRPPLGLLRHRGARVRDRAPAHAADASTSARASSPPSRPSRPTCDWSALGTEAYAEAAGEYLLPALDEPPERRCSTSCATRSRARHAAGDAAGPLRPDPRPLRVPRGRDVRRLDRRGVPRGGGAGVCQDYVHLGADPAAPQRHRGALRQRLPVGGARRTRATTPSRSRRTPGSRRCCPARTAAASRSGSAPTRRTAGSPASATSRSATGATTATSRRCAASTRAARRRSSTRASR